MGNVFFFYLFSFVLIFAASMVIMARNMVHSVMYLVLCFFNAAGLFILLKAELIAMILVIVYVGAVAVLFLFIVMMLDIKDTTIEPRSKTHLMMGLCVGGIFLAELIFVFFNWSSADSNVQTLSHAVGGFERGLTNTHMIGRILYTDYLLAFQLAGMILLVAMIGAIMLTLRNRTNIARQDPSKQVSRRMEDTLKVNKVKFGQGIE